MTATPTRPPSTSMTLPLTNCDSSEARYTAACAIASGVPNAPYGVPFIIAAAGSFSIGVRTTPGEIALMRTPGDPNSAAQARVRVSIAPFVDAYSAPTGIPNRATQEPRLMIDPSAERPGGVGSEGLGRLRGAVEVRGDELGVSAGRVDLLDNLGAALGAASADD